ncbi:helix-turn-helix domain-containing protein [Nostoc sp. FACHB-152]|uniref:helix-turn-helix domain-containing protein n=1 Tax=unclassified Nostoc TaxID=2593658 RepID=UPI001685F85A|nr:MULTISPECIES: helix-turn-helix domain-containing protein [unclassified Nostoc]MBD2451304.1 helix-turn-helix domain-containing protein [Nostoc sp. FACHB-152]MBD2471270.1 helix-turn-helix domain-containing protein [Nostoc sp. FACHB-145]
MSPYQSTPEIQRLDNSEGKFLTTFQRKMLQKSLQEDLPRSYHQRIQIMLLADQGKTQTEICEMLGCCPATVRHWTHIARAGMAHQWQDCAIGRPKTVNEQYLERLRELISHSPRDYGYSFRRWTTNWLQKHLTKEFGMAVSDRHIKRLLKQMGLSTRPKPSNVEGNTNENKHNSKILIGDLKSADIPDNDEFMPMNFVKLDKDSDIYGAKSIRSLSFSGTIEPHFGAFPNPCRIPALSGPS